MKQLQAAQFLQWIKAPYTIIGVITVLGILINVSLYTRLIVPASQSEAAAVQRIDSLTAQKTMLDKRPIPSKASDKDIENLLKQVPTKEELARWIIAMKEIEQASGATIESLMAGAETKSDPLAAFKPPSTGNTENATRPTGSNAAVNSSGSAAGLEELQLTLTIRGTYAQSMDFLSRLYQAERFVNIKDWTLQTIEPKTNAPQISSVTGVQTPSRGPSEPTEKVKLELRTSIYTAKGYAGKFNDLAPLPTEDAVRRLDPTWSDEHFRALLQTLQP